MCLYYFFFFKQKTAYEIYQCDWSSDVCSSDLIGIISPWNYPFIIPFHEIMMALTAGNSVILKAAAQSQPVGKLIQTIFDEADLPADIIRVVNLPGKITGKAFIDAGIDKILFTGSTETGREIAELAGKNLVSVSFELGGSDAMIILPDANLKRAANGALWAGLSNSGQSCGGVERIYAADSVYDKFKEILLENAKKISTGPAGGSGTEIGPLTTKKQKEKVSGYVEDAVRKGARAIYRSDILPGENGSGFFYPVTILENVPADAPVMQEEIFGPVLVLERVKDESEIIRKANDSPLGLTSSLWTSSRKKASYLPHLLETGVVSVNDHLMSHGMPETPWGGYKDSGHSMTHGKWGLYEVTRVKVVVHERFPWTQRDPWWYPHDKGLYEKFKNMLFLLGGPGARSSRGGNKKKAGIFKRISRFTGAVMDMFKIILRFF